MSRNNIGFTFDLLYNAKIFVMVIIGDDETWGFNYDLESKDLP